MRILFIGDIFGRPGRTIVKERLSSLVKEHSIDLVLANGENAAAGFGITPPLAEDLFEMGIDVLTTGNHIWADRYDGELADVFALQDEITKKVVAAIEPKLLEAEALRSPRHPLPTPPALPDSSRPSSAPISSPRSPTIRILGRRVGRE